VFVRRAGALVLTLALTWAAASMFGTVAQSDGYDWLDVLRIALIAVAGFWLAWGTCTALLGVLFASVPPLRSAGKLSSRTAILMPVYNEVAEPVMARIEAMYRALEGAGYLNAFDLFVLSDSTRAEAITAEQNAFRTLLMRLQDGNRLFYRHREKNVGRKAGNIADFVRNSGGAYDFMLVLDADSLMRAETIVEMVRRMEADTKLGLLQSLPQTIGLKTLFGRLMQFSSFLYAPSFSRGVAALQGRAGPFWGHNALIRTRAFAQSCGMAPLNGKAPFGGHVLSHDTVEAALLARDGWSVRLDADLTGSYEEAPANMLEYAKRDRRWCQGNLQHGKILLAPRLRMWSRAMILQGIFAYLASPVWLIFLVSSLAAPMFAPPPVYFDGRSPFPVFPHPETTVALALLFGVGALLILPKAILLIRALVLGQGKQFGGGWLASLSAVCELFLTSLLAPIHMMFQTRSVLEILSGRDAGWPAASRDDGTLSFWEALSGSWWMVLTGAASLAFSHLYVPDLWFWLLPVAVPLAMSPLLIWSTASVWLGGLLRKAGLLVTPVEQSGDEIIQLMEDSLLGQKGQAEGPRPLKGTGVVLAGE
jgi:membrane glycosyltransferase